MATENRVNFWRRNAKVPGSYLKETKLNLNSLKSKKASSFHEFARSTNDAWDIEDEEDEEFVSSAALSLCTHSQTRSSSTDKPMLQQSDSGDDCTLYTGTMVQSSSDPDLQDSSTTAFNHRHVQEDLSSAPRPPSLPSRPIIPLVARISDQNSSGAPPMTVREKSRLDKFRALLCAPNTDLDELRKHSWSGIPREVRPVTWRLLSGYLPANKERREHVLQRKREEYFGFIEQYYDSRNDEPHRDTYRQIHIDIPRTNPLIPLFQQPAVQEL